MGSSYLEQDCDKEKWMRLGVKGGLIETTMFVQYLRQPSNVKFLILFVLQRRNSFIVPFL